MKCGFQPYEGKEPYLFVSYSRKDNGKVAPVLEELHRLGVRIWYDDAMEGGDEWREEIAEHILRCGVFVAFHSSASAVSRHCLAEISGALSDRNPRNIPIVSIYLERDPPLRRGIQNYLDLYQHENCYEYQTARQFVEERLKDLKYFAPCRENTAEGDSSPVSLWNRDGPVMWRLNEYGVLTIRRGEADSGEMPAHQWDYVNIVNSAPWMKDPDRITAVVVEEGITSVSPGAFAGCGGVHMALISGSVREIGREAFFACPKLTCAAMVPGEGTRIQDSAFMGCTSLTSVTIPQRASIGRSAFANCTSLTAVHLCESVGSIGELAFRNCVSLRSASVSAKTEVSPDAFDRVTHVQRN